MRPVKRLDGSTDYHIMDFKLSATAIVDQAVIASTTGADGGEATDATTTSLLDFVGSVLSASDFNPHGGSAGSLTYSTTQGDAEGLVRVYINPDAIYEAPMSGGAAAGTALTTYTAAAANAGGTTFTDADAGTSMDDGTCWGIAPNNNIEQSRKITTHTIATGAITVTVPFLRAINAADAFLLCPYLPLTGTTVQLGTLLTQADASIAVGTGGNARIVELVLNGTTNSFVRFIGRDHCFNELS